MIGFALDLLLSWPFLVVLVVSGILFEHNEARGLAVFTGILATVISYFYFKIPAIDLAYGIAGYGVVGVLWSFYRYKRYVSKQVANAKAMTDNQKESLIHRLHPSKMLGTITAWIMIWPFSVIDNLIGDIINAVEALVKTVFKGVYNRIYHAAIADLK